MSAFCAEPHRLFELTTRILCDTRPEWLTINALYVYAQTTDNQWSSLGHAIALASKTYTNTAVAISALGRVAGYDGYDNWRHCLTATNQVRGECIVPVPAAAEWPPCTYAEAVGLVRLAREHGWKRVCVIAPPMHMVRAFVSTVSAVRLERSELQVYSEPASAGNWQKEVIHSQGITTGARKDLLRGEFERLQRYHDKGDLVSAEEVLAYLDWRDAQR